MQRKFIVTVDVEGDDLWNYEVGREVKTDNARFIPRFQQLCENYEIKPVYLVDYEMAMSKEWMTYLKPLVIDGKCEAGIHIHGWNTPPIIEIESKYSETSYITEYSSDIQLKKILTVKSLLEELLETEIISHRSGRWAMDEHLPEILEMAGINIDCSVTPQLNLTHIPGSSVNKGFDYRKREIKASYLNSSVLEVPMTTRRMHAFRGRTVGRCIKNLLLGQNVWMRPFLNNLDSMKYLVDFIDDHEDTDYIELMIHSSELMPGANPYFKTEDDVNALYNILGDIFVYTSGNGYVSNTLKEYKTNFDKLNGC